MAPFCFHKAFIYTCPTKEACKSLDTFLAKDGKEKDKLRTDIQKQLNIRNGFSAVSYKKQAKHVSPRFWKALVKSSKKSTFCSKYFLIRGIYRSKILSFACFFCELVLGFSFTFAKWSVRVMSCVYGKQ